MAGLTSLPKKKNIKGQPHKLAYITEDESNLLKSMGGAGKPVQGTKGVPAFYSDPGDAGDMGGPDASDAESAGGDPEGSMGFSAASFGAAQEAADDDPTGVDSSIDVGRQGFDPDVLDLNYESYFDIPTELQFDRRGLFAPEDPIDEMTATRRYRERIIPRKIPYTYELLADPVIDVLPKLDSLIDRNTAKDLGANYVDMLKEVGIEAAEEKNTELMETIQTQLDKGLLADYYQDYTPMNALEKAGYKTFGTGYRGAFEARTGAENQAVTRDQYDPNTITGAGTGERSEKISLFNQFALENPNMTAMEAMAAFNNIGSFGTISAVDLGMLGYSPDSRVGPQVESNEAERRRGALQGLGMVGQAIVGGPVSMMGIAEKMAFSGTPNTGIFDTMLDGLNNATKKDGVGIVDDVNSVYDSFTNTLEEARDAVVDAVQENVFDPVAEFFSPEQEAAYNPAIGMADPNLAGRSGISFTGSPFSGLPSDTFENYTNALAGLEEAEAAPGTVAADQMSEALQNAAYYDSLMNPEAISPPEPSSFFTGLDPVETQEYIDRATTPEGVKLIRQRQPVPAAPLPTVADQFSPVEIKNFFPGSFSQPPSKLRTRTQTLADLYDISEDEANRMLGTA